MESCRICKFFKEDQEVVNGDGICRRYAPRAVVMADSFVNGDETVWPPVLKEDWCGDWKSNGHLG